MTDEPKFIRCVPFTRAKRHASMIGSVWGYTSWPLPVTNFQFAAGLVAMVGLGFTAPLWGHFGLLNVPLFFGGVLLAVFATRQIRIEGRSPGGFLLGVGASLASRPRLAGRKFRSRLVTRYEDSRVLLVPDDGWRCTRWAVVPVKHGRGHRLRHNYWHRRQA